MLTTTFTDPSERGRAFGIYGAISGGGGALGLLLGGILTSYASWRWTLFVNVAIGAVAIAGAAPVQQSGRQPAPSGPARAVRSGLRVLPRRDHVMAIIGSKLWYHPRWFAKYVPDPDIEGQRLEHKPAEGELTEGEPTERELVAAGTSGWE